MNLVSTKAKANQKFSISESPDDLLNLPASNTMEKTGDVFDPGYYLLDEETSIVYRKEQFESGESLPAELVVRDLRFSRETITTLCEEAGFEVLWARYVKAGKWDGECVPEQAKEILVLCQRGK